VVSPIPGPSSPIAALSASGLPTDKFTFIGFLPGKQTHRLKLFRELSGSLNVLSSTVIFFESPYRIAKSLADLKEIFGDIEVVIAREITKMYEEIKRARISEFLKDYLQKEPKGEMVVLFNLKSQ
jgi:16S rRNA (cytidine1402-2'-O)-methyltransferase